MKDRFFDYINREDIFPYRLRAAYTVEAAAVVGICMVFIGLLFMGGIHLYGSAMGTLTAYEIPDDRPQDLFRFTRAIGDILGDDGKVTDTGDSYKGQE